MTIKERCQGCLVGGAAGDALGYEVEFISLHQIRKQFGKSGITDYVLHNGKAIFSDDTQMTLFTAEGLLHAEAATQQACYVSIVQAYQDWFLTQYTRYPLKEERAAHSELLHVPELFSRRAPGNTCLSAIQAGCNGTIHFPKNKSKGCGGVMRMAPVGLFRKLSADECDLLGANAAAMTHGHDLGWLPAAMLAHMIRLLTYENADMHTTARSGIAAMPRMFPRAKHMAAFTELMENAVRLADSKVSTDKAISKLGEGWVGDEAMAIALYCALKFEEDFAAGIIAAVNHDGDSDSTGAIAGNLLGARLGLSGIPEKYRTDLELYDLLMDMGEKLAAVSEI